MVFRSCVLIGGLLIGMMASAEEGGTGHYLPGSIASSVDKGLPAPAFVVRLNAIAYSGEFDKNINVPIAGLLAADIEVDTEVVGLTLAWRPSWGNIGSWSYAMNATLPYIYLDVEADVASPAVPGTKVRRSDSIEDIGDMVLSPVQLSGQLTKAWRMDTRLNIYAPTGSYQVGRLANTGKNYWSVEPIVGFLYMDQQNGLEFDSFVGATFNEENSDTNYKSGTQIHAESTLAQHFPLAGGGASVGATGYWYQQVTGDSGSEANYGNFKGKVIGVGPVIAYEQKLSEAVSLSSELKWVHEFEADRRAEGDTVYLKVLFIY